MPVPKPQPGLYITNANISNTRFTRSNQQGAVSFASTTITGDLAHDGGDVGFFGTAPTTQQTALTAQHASLTQAGTDSGDVAIQAATDSSMGAAFGFANAAEFEAVVACVINLMTRVQELEDKLQAYGLLA